MDDDKTKLELQLCDAIRERNDWRHSAEFLEALLDVANGTADKLISALEATKAEREEARAWARRLKRERDEWRKAAVKLAQGKEAQ